MKKILLSALILLIVSVACSKDAASGDAGYVSGKVTDSRGNAIANAKIIIHNTVWFNKNIVITSDANGNYRYKMPATDSWYVRGTTDITYNGKMYTLDLHPDFAGAFAGSDGKVVNLQWKLTGELPKDFGTDGYYGGAVVMDAGYNLFDLKGITLTLTPMGKLIDGSDGQVITTTVNEVAGSFRLNDISLGRYTIKAKLNGSTCYIKMRNTTDFHPEVTVDFEPAYLGATTYGLYFQVVKTP